MRNVSKHIKNRAFTMIHFKTTLSRHLSNLSMLIFLLALAIVMSIVVYNIDFDFTVICIIFGFFLIINAPVLIIHLSYWVEDKNKLVQIDLNNKTLNLTKGNHDRIYKFDDIKHVILTVQSSFKLGEPSRKAPWADYFYYQIYFKNNDKLILTSLILKQKDFPLTVHHRRFSFVQTIDKFDYDSFIDAEIKTSRQINHEEIDKFKDIYKDYSQSELQEIVDNKKKYESAAIKAAKELLKK